MDPVALDMVKRFEDHARACYEQGDHKAASAALVEAFLWRQRSEAPSVAAMYLNRTN